MWLPGMRFNRKRTVCANFARFSGLRQRLVNHADVARSKYDLLTSVVKPIATALWQSCGNRAAQSGGSWA
jgi:hypothetical protein